ncbi:hypothetical protein [Bradyrhizobium genosp. P]|uniref:hypothetical protein n=1 Tax=Bradyrhizobium genosp. P TaxID=83641 RepID=UPI003CEBC54F
MTGTVTPSETAPFRRREYVRRSGAADGPLDAVIRSAVAVVRESAGLLCHVAELGIVLVLDAGSTAPARRALAESPPAPGAANIIRFPTRRNTKPRK